MAVTNYYTLNGEIIGEKVGANARTDYLTDALGSVTGTVNQSAQVVNTYQYKPYGALLAKTGAGADPAFQWVGQHGYRQTSKKWAHIYPRSNHYDTEIGRWISLSPAHLPLSAGQASANGYRYLPFECASDRPKPLGITSISGSTGRSIDLAAPGSIIGVAYCSCMAAVLKTIPKKDWCSEKPPGCIPLDIPN